MIALISGKPFVGYFGAAFGFLSGILTILKILTPILGFAGAAFGAAAGLITLLIKLGELRDRKRKSLIKLRGHKN
jgi:hypothetical protein